MTVRSIVGLNPWRWVCGMDASVLGSEAGWEPESSPPTPQSSFQCAQIHCLLSPSAVARVKNNLNHSERKNIFLHCTRPASTLRLPSVCSAMIQTHPALAAVDKLSCGLEGCGATDDHLRHGLEVAAAAAIELTEP